jgi:hypothetical protein
MPFFRIVIEAKQYTGENIREIFAFARQAIVRTDTSSGGHPVFQTPKGNLMASPGDWIIKGVKGEFYPCKPDIFQATYEPVEED